MPMVVCHLCNRAVENLSRHITSECSKRFTSMLGIAGCVTPIVGEATAKKRLAGEISNSAGASSDCSLLLASALKQRKITFSTPATSSGGRRVIESNVMPGTKCSNMISPAGDATNSFSRKEVEVGHNSIDDPVHPLNLSISSHEGDDEFMQSTAERGASVSLEQDVMKSLSIGAQLEEADASKHDREAAASTKRTSAYNKIGLSNDIEFDFVKCVVDHNLPQSAGDDILKLLRTAIADIESRAAVEAMPSKGRLTIARHTTEPLQTLHTIQQQSGESTDAEQIGKHILPKMAKMHLTDSVQVPHDRLVLHAH
jgi:hypothetical protein